MWRGRPFFTLFLRWGLTMNSGENSWKVLRLCVAPLFAIIAHFDLCLWENISDNSDFDFCRHHTATCVLSVLLSCFLWLASSVTKSRWGMFFTPCFSITHVWDFELIYFPSFLFWAGLWHSQGNNHQKCQGWAVAAGVRFNEDPHTSLA